MIYLDQASTSHPKPAAVLKGISNYFRKIGVNPHRSLGRLAAKAEAIIEETRSRLAALFNIADCDHIAFTQNATHAINIVLKGALQKGDHVLISNFEHNAVLRPLQKMKESLNVSFDIFESCRDGLFDLAAISRLITPRTRLVICNHASNVLGVISPIEEIGKLAKKHNLLFLVDAAQTAGLVDIDVEKAHIDFLAGTAHKSLLGPSGVGFLYIRNPDIVSTFTEGGSGFHSASVHQPNAMPHKFEAGTLNYLGIAGFLEALKHLERCKEKRQRESALLSLLLQELKNIPGLILYGTRDIGKKIPLISINLLNFYPQELANLLEERYSLITRPGLHCAPLIHKTLATYPTGTLRISLSQSNTADEIKTLSFALRNVNT